MTIITDNVSNNDVMMMILNEILQTFSTTSHLSCLTHVIQLTVKQLLKTLMLNSKNENEKKY
jgi:4-hydroxy-L-threonine phosphate dehydrogenase PdxA